MCVGNVKLRQKKCQLRAAALVKLVKRHSTSMARPGSEQRKLAAASTLGDDDWLEDGMRVHRIEGSVQAVARL